jgi:hypothetical protein
VIGLGGAAAVVGTIGYFSNKSKIDEAAQKCENPEAHTGCPDSATKDGNDARKQMTVSAVIGAAGLVAVGSGLVWWWLDGRSQGEIQTSSRRPQLTPVVGPGVAGLTLSGAF